MRSFEWGVALLALIGAARGASAAEAGLELPPVRPGVEAVILRLEEARCVS
jgi:hypothetical protein